MTLPGTDTVVTYPDGATRQDSLVLHCEPLGGGRFVVLLDSTPCHPVDAGWPDQGADRAVLRLGDGTVATVTDAVVGATDGSMLLIGAEVPVRPGTEGWSFVVAHIVDSPIEEGALVHVEVDDDTAVPSPSATRPATSPRSRSTAPSPAAGERRSAPTVSAQPDFDRSAIASSLIRENGSTDSFRLNTSLRRKGSPPTGSPRRCPPWPRRSPRPSTSGSPPGRRCASTTRERD